MCHRIPPCRAHDAVTALLETDIIDPFDTEGEVSDDMPAEYDEPEADPIEMKRAA